MLPDYCVNHEDDNIFSEIRNHNPCYLSHYSLFNVATYWSFSFSFAVGSTLTRWVKTAFLSKTAAEVSTTNLEK